MPDIAEALQQAYRAGRVLTADGKDHGRVAAQTAAKRRSPATLSRATQKIAAAHPEATFVREEQIETKTFRGKVDIHHFHVPEERRRRRGDIILDLLPPATEKKKHGGRRTITVPPQVAEQEAPVRRETRHVERFISLATDQPLAERTSPPPWTSGRPPGWR